MFGRLLELLFRIVALALEVLVEVGRHAGRESVGLVEGACEGERSKSRSAEWTSAGTPRAASCLPLSLPRKFARTSFLQMGEVVQLGCEFSRDVAAERT